MDESNITDTAQLIKCIPGIDNASHVHAELASSCSVKCNMTGKDLFLKLKETLLWNWAWKNRQV
jgi:hypothetical protein